MKFTLINTGRTFQGFIREGVTGFEKRLNRYIPFESVMVPELKKSSKLSQLEIKIQEGRALLALLEPGDYVVLLDEKGKSYSSEQFAGWIQDRLNAGGKRVVFIIGGAYGFSDEVYQRAQEQISLSKMTFSHQMVRLFFIEQLYRAFSILRGDPYHHG